MGTWDTKAFAMIVGGILAILLLVSWVWLAVDCDAIQGWCAPAEATLLKTNAN